MVTPECPPMTGTRKLRDSVGFPATSAMKVEARTTSRVVTPKRLRIGDKEE